MSVVADMKQDKGMELIDLLGLKVKPNGRVDTEGGDKTPLGLFLTVESFMEKAQASIAKEDEIVANLIGVE